MATSHDSTERINLQCQVGPDDPRSAIDFLALQCGLSKARLKDAMSKGAVWLHSRRGGRKRLRRATAELSVDDRLELYYDPAILALLPPVLQCLHDSHDYSVWYKPPGILAQGSEYGDHCSLLRLVEVQLKRPVFLVHRLDREAQGIMLVAHRQQAAAHFSRLFQQNGLEKHYRVMVRGNIAATHGQAGRVERPLDGKTASTEYVVLQYDAALDVSTLKVRLHTGRLHQIRRHFEALGHPVLGDPRYGRHNKDAAGLRLAAVELAFTEPGSTRRVHIAVPESMLPF